MMSSTNNAIINSHENNTLRVYYLNNIQGRTDSVEVPEPMILFLDLENDILEPKTRLSVIIQVLY